MAEFALHYYLMPQFARLCRLTEEELKKMTYVDIDESTNCPECIRIVEDFLKDK